MTAKRRTTRSKTVRQFIRVCRVERFQTEADAVEHAKTEAAAAGIVVGEPKVDRVQTASKADAWRVVFPVSGTTPKSKAAPRKKAAPKKQMTGGLTVEKVTTGRYRWLVKKGTETVSKHRTKTEAEEAAR